MLKSLKSLNSIDQDYIFESCCPPLGWTDSGDHNWGVMLGSERLSDYDDVARIVF